MHGLRTSSVLILDDNDEEAIPIQKALATCGIGAILISGAPGEEEPKEPIRGIRVAVLDIYLLDDPSQERQIRYTGDLVNRLIDESNGPYVAVVWTDNSEVLDEFKEELEKIACPPVLTVNLDKTDVLATPGREARAEKILSSIRTALAESPPLDFSNLWEQIIRDAATDTLVSLQLDRPPESESSRSLAFLAALLRSEANRSGPISDRDAVRSLMAALNPVHLDRIEVQATNLAEDLESAIEPIRKAVYTRRPDGVATSALEGYTGEIKIPELELAELSELNAALLFDPRSDEFGAGRIYSHRGIATLRLGLHLPGTRQIRASTVEKDHLGRAVTLPVVYLEMSAACDHKGGNVTTARLIAGVAFAASRIKEHNNSLASSARVPPRKAEYLLAIEPIRLPDMQDFPSEDIVFVWNARFPVSVSAERLRGIDPIGKLREPLLSDIRAWLAYHSSRPGHQSV